MFKRLFSRKSKTEHVERTPEVVELKARILKEKIIQYSDGKIPEKDALLLAYRSVALMDFDNKAAMHTSLDQIGEQIAKNNLELFT
ncbi:MAG: hypothetical protein J5717_11600 [Lachnospiraceae bacterium]|nr:hypothetical protein [Lachnospiraceae bacterium]